MEGSEYAGDIQVSVPFSKWLAKLVSPPACRGTPPRTVAAAGYSPQRQIAGMCALWAAIAFKSFKRSVSSQRRPRGTTARLPIRPGKSLRGNRPTYKHSGNGSRHLGNRLRQLRNSPPNRSGEPALGCGRNGQIRLDRALGRMFLLSQASRRF